MHILSNPLPIPTLDGRGFELEAGEWLLNNESAFKLALRAERDGATVRPWKPNDLRGRNKSRIIADEALDIPAPRSILLIRSGAIGDLLFLSCCITPLQAKYPNAQIWICCHKRHWDIFAGLSHFIEYPLPIAELVNFDLVIPLENIVEIATEKGQHAIDAFADALGVKVTDYRPVYHVTGGERFMVQIHYGKTLAKRTIPNQPLLYRPRVGLQLRASAKIRDYHMEHWGEVVNELLKRGWEVMLLGQNNPDVKPLGPNIKDCSALYFREAAAVLATCDVFCGVDSSFFNLCPALGVPAIGLFGPVDWKTRVKDGMGQYALAGVGDCAPCGWTNSRAGQKFPPHGPCAKVGYCVPLADITPERIVAKIERHAKPCKSA
jgi:ADP-heptose:LPS heptosyltransferase